MVVLQINTAIFKNKYLQGLSKWGQSEGKKDLKELKIAWGSSS